MPPHRDAARAERPAPVERKAHHTTVAGARGDHRVAVRGDRHVADGVTGIHRVAERGVHGAGAEHADAARRTVGIGRVPGDPEAPGRPQSTRS